MIALIAAVARNGVIGKDGKIPWRLPEDMKRFKQLTTGHILVMGRKTYESIGRPLPGRTIIVLTRSNTVREVLPSKDGSVQPPDLVMSESSMEEALSWASGDVFICGGADVYREALERDIVDRMYLTEIDVDYDGDTRFPIDNIDSKRFNLVTDQERVDGGVRYAFRTYDRRR